MPSGYPGTGARCANCKTTLHRRGATGLCQVCLVAHRREQARKCVSCGKLFDGAVRKTGKCFTCLHPGTVSPSAAPIFGPVNALLDAAARVTKLDRANIVGTSRYRQYLWARHAVVLLARRQRVSFPRIGKVVNRSPDVVYASACRAKKLMAESAEFAALVRAIETIAGSGGRV